MEILVAGGGPAGCIAGRCGRRGPSGPADHAPAPAAVEGLSERVLRALEANGCRRALAAVGPAVRREASWNGATTAANQEWVVARERLDAALLEDVRRGRGRDRRRPDREAPRVPRAGSSRPLRSALAGAYLVEARGRRAPGGDAWASDNGARGGVQGRTTRARTAVTGFRRGWAWYASTGDGGRACRSCSRRRSRCLSGRRLPRLIRRSLDEIGPVREAGRGSCGRRGLGPSCRSEPRRPADRRRHDPGRRCRARDGPALRSWRVRGDRLGDSRSAGDQHILRRPRSGARTRVLRGAQRLTYERVARIGRDFYRARGAVAGCRLLARARAMARRSAGACAAVRRAGADRGQAGDRGRLHRRAPGRGHGRSAARRMAGRRRAVGQLSTARRAGRRGAVRSGRPQPRFGRAPGQVGTALAWLRYRGLLRS